MLLSLNIKNVVLIDSLTLDFSDGLSVLTGETGAGKSILLDSLSLALGGRSDVTLIRQGQPSLSVTATFELPMDHVVFNVLKEHDIEWDDLLILRRVVYADGRSKAFVNDQPVSVSLLKQIGGALVEIHGQFALTTLLNPANHLGILDAYGRLEADVQACKEAWSLWQMAVNERIKAYECIERAKADELYIRTSLDDLERLNPKVGEEEQLIQQRQHLINGEKITEALSAVQQLLEGDDHGVTSLLNKSAFRLEKADTLSGGMFQEALTALDEARNAIEVAVQIIEAKGHDTFDTQHLPELDERLFALKAAARKHGVAVDELPTVIHTLKTQLSTLESGEEQLSELIQKEAVLKHAYLNVAGLLSKKRQLASRKLDEGVMAELPALKLTGCRFETSLTQCPIDEVNADGMDQVLFLVATNKGNALSPIHKVASGGELSRFMLALKVNLASAGLVSSIVFDEVDSGVGGATAEAVGRRLSRLGELCQVLVVTHSPQVAGYGRHHFKVVKRETSDGVKTSVEQLNQEQRITELARMLSGETCGATAMAMAEELMRG